MVSEMEDEDRERRSSIVDLHCQSRGGMEDGTTTGTLEPSSEYRSAPKLESYSRE